VRLRQRAGVVENTIRLSDLLPEDVPAELLERAKAVELGRSPQPGSYRVLSAGEITARMREIRLTQISVPQQVVVERQALPVSREAVKRAVVEFFRSANEYPAFDFEIVGSPVMSGHPSSLVVESARWDERLHRTEFSLRCADKACGSFLVRSASRTETAAVKKMLRPKVWLARAGQPALLTFDGGGMRISLRVVCLERGTLGQTIRVRESGTHREFRAEVTGAGTVRATL